MKFKSVILVLISCLWLSSCKTMDSFEMPEMPDVTKLFQFGTKSDEKTPQNNTIITEPVVDMTAPPMICDVFDGQALMNNSWQAHTPRRFSIRKNQVGSFSLKNKSETEGTKVQVRFDEDGQKLVFCPAHLVGRQDLILCENIYALEDDFIVGIRRTLDIQDLLRGGTIECKISEIAF